MLSISVLLAILKNELCSLSGELETEYRILNYCIVPITMATQEIRAPQIDNITCTQVEVGVQPK